MKPGQNVAVIGAGVAGLSAAWLIAKQHHVTLFETENRLGGHTHTVMLDSGSDAGLGVDTGFIVCNNRNYPLFHKFLAELGVTTRDADMSFGYENEQSGLAYSGNGLNGLLAQRGNALKPKFWRFVRDILRFQKAGRAALAKGNLAGKSLGQFMREAGLGLEARRDYVLPMGSAIWSAPYDKIETFPAESFLRFFENHGLLSISDMPRWQTVLGGSHSYLKAFGVKFKGKVQLGEAIRGLKRHDDRVEMQGSSRSWSFDQAVLATHADQALSLLQDADETERVLLGSWTYQENHVTLHRDESFLPRNPRARASWNYRLAAGQLPQDGATLTYDMRRLQGLQTQSPYCITLNSRGLVPREKLLREIVYEHPVFDANAVATQPFLPSLNSRRRTYFCGSYFGWGFHEDAVKAGNEVGRHFGNTL